MVTRYPIVQSSPNRIFWQGFLSLVDLIVLRGKVSILEGLLNRSKATIVSSETYHLQFNDQLFRFCSTFLSVSNTVDGVDKMEEWAKTLAMFVRNLMADKRKKGGDLQCHVRFLCHAIVNFSNGSRLCGTCVKPLWPGGGPSERSGRAIPNFLSFSTLVTWRKKKLSSVMVLSLHSTSHKYVT